MSAEKFIRLRLLLIFACLCPLTHSRERLEAPKITHGPRNRTILAKSHGVFVCQASGNPAPRIDWFLNGHKLDVAKGGYLIFKMPHGSVLRLPNTGVENHGSRILCLASNPLGNATARAVLNVKDDEETLPKGFPTILQTGTTVIKQKNQDATLKCKSRGSPQPQTEWYKDYLPINLSDPRYTVEKDQLLIRKVLEEDEGVYECMVTNKHGTVAGQVMKVYVRVRRYPPHFLPGLKKRVSVLPGSAVNLTCIAAGSPMPEIKWRQGVNFLMPRARHIGRYTLMLTDIRESGNFTCVASSRLGEVEHTVQVLVKELPKPPNRVYTTHAEARSAGLRWPPSPSDDVESYTVLVRRKDSDRETPPRQFPNIPRPASRSDQYVHYTVTKLEPNTRYEVRVMAISKIGRSPPSEPIEFKTNELPPGSAPRNVRAEAITTRTLSVTWQPPKEKNGEITGYKVYFTQNPKLEVNKWQVLRVNKAHSANINHLHSNATYHISVSALNSAGEGPISDHFPVIVTPGVPSRPRNFQAITLGPNSIQLAWEPPEGSEESPSSRVQEYVLKYKAADSFRMMTKSLPGDKKAYLMQHLNPDTKYTMSLTARTDEGLGVPAKTSARTNEYVPRAPPQNINAQPKGPNSVRLCWEPPPRAMRNGRIVSYMVSYGRADSGTTGGSLASVGSGGHHLMVKVEANRSCYTITNLSPWTRYKMWVAAATRYGLGNASAPVIVTTEESVPTSPVIERVEVRGSTQLRVYWRPPREERGRIEYFTVDYYRTNATGFALGALERTINVKPEAARDKAGRHWADIKGLMPNSWYRVMVRAVTRRGRGDPARFRPVKTNGEVPSRPRGLRVKARLVTLEKREHPVLVASWQSPDVKHGEILQYRVRFSIQSPKDMMELATEEVVNVSTRQYTSSSKQIHFGVTYDFRVAAMNAVDFGDESMVLVTTPDAPPSASPQSLVVTDRGPNEVELKWKSPAKAFRNGRIVQFEVRHFQREQRDTTETNLNTTLTSLAIGNLRTRTFYAFMVRAWTSSGGGPWTNPVYHQTSTDPLPPPPSDIRMVRLNERLIKVTWRFPSSLRGSYRIKGFRLYYSDRDEPSDQLAWTKVDMGPVFSYQLKNLAPTTSYVVRMSTISEQGRVGRWSGPVLPSVVDIPRLTPLTVRDLTCTADSADQLRIAWKEPERVKDLLSFRLRVLGRATYVDHDGKTQQHDERVRLHVIPYPRSGKHYLRAESGLRPNTNYLLSLTSVYRMGTVSSRVNRRVNTSCATLALPPDEVIAPLPVSRALHPRLVVGLELRRASERNGIVANYLLVVAPVAVARQMAPAKLTSDELMKMAGPGGRRLSGPLPDRAAFAASDAASVGAEARLFAAYLLRARALFAEGQASATFKVGAGLAGGRALARDVDYVAFLRACVKPRGRQVECRDSAWSQVFGSRREPVGTTGRQTEQSRGLQMVLLVGGPIVVALFLLVCVVVWCFFRRRPKLQRDLRRHNPVDHSLKQPLMGSPPPPPYQPMPTDPVEMRRLNYQTPAMMSHPPIPIGQFEAHVAGCKANDNMKFSQEYESIDPGQQFTWEHSNLDANKPKNRYANVIAYDHSRLVLQPVDGIPGSDYINANYMDGYKKQNAYIATQGPLPETVGDFWRMVWEQRSSTIVMMTRLEERARVKCDLYWPQKGSESYDECMLVSHLDTLELAYYTIRTFAVQRHGSPEKREVRQFQFTAWPDHGVPDHPTPLLMFLRRVRAANPPDAGPVVVHCSAGVGRTGAFIVIDAMLERIKQEKTVDVYGHVTCLRAQRNYTVQTEDQYIFIHDVLLEAVLCGNTEVPARNLAVHVQKLRQLEGAGRSQVTGMELEFRKIGLKPSNSPFLSANLPPNRLKNRLVNVLPYESTRVCLQPIRGVEGSDYINASFIDGYLSRRAYIATQAPLAETTEDLWRMLWEHNSTIVVMLTKLREMGRDKCHQYWPTARSARYQYFVVDPLSEYNMNNYILREFKVTDARDGQSRTIRQFQYTEWPEQGVPPSGESLIDFIGQVHKTKKQFGQDGPITVHCSAGVGRTGVFLTLAVVLDRMRYEGVADMFQTVKMLRTQRPAMVQTEDQYQFCYACAIEYLNSFDHYATDVR